MCQLIFLYYYNIIYIIYIIDTLLQTHLFFSSFFPGVLPPYRDMYQPVPHCMMETSVATMTVPLVTNTGVGDTAATAVATRSICMDSHSTNAIATVSMASDQSGDFVATVLPPGGFSLVDLGLEKLQVQVDQLQLQGQPTQQQVEVNFEEVDDTDDGVNLVVKATYWWCKDCNIKQKFGCGESMDDHLRLKHRINNKPGAGKAPGGCETETESPVVALSGRAPGQEAPVSDVVAAVYAIPSDSVTGQDQAVDTLIVFDDATTLQVITEASEDNGCLFPVSPNTAGGNQMPDESKSSLTVVSNLGAYGPSESLRPTGAGALSHIQPIPAILALPPANQLSVSAPTPVKVENSEPPGYLESHHGSDVEDAEIAPAVQSLYSTLEHEKCSHASGGNSSRLKLRTSHVATRRQTRQDTAKKSDDVKLPECSVAVKRISPAAVKEKKMEKNSTLMKSGTKRLSPGELKQSKGRQDSVSVKSKSVRNLSKLTSVRRSGRRQRASSHLATGRHLSSSHRHSVKRARHSPDTSFEVLDDVSVIHTHSKVNTCRSSGRRIKKPMRYITGSESEEEDRDKNVGTQPLASDAPQESSSSTDPQLEEVNPQKPARQLKKHKATVAEAQPKPKRNATEALEVPPSKSAKKTAREEKYCCRDCGRKFRFENKFKKHVELYAGQTMQQCSVCDVRLHNLDLLNVHIYHVHKTQECTCCLTCGDALGSKRNLLNHLLTHPKAKGQTVANLIKDSCATHRCSICDESIIEGEGRVEKHYVTHSKPNAHSCQKCGQSFRHKSDLYHHLKEHGESDKVLLQSVDRGQTERKSQQSNLMSIKPQQVQEIISQSVQQILRFEENTPQSLPNQITVTFIPSNGFGEAETVQVPTSSLSQPTRPLLSCQSCGKQFRSKKLLYQHLRTHEGGESAAPSSAVNGDSPRPPGEEEPACQPIDLAAGVPFGIPCSLVKLEGLEGVDDYVVKSFTTTAEGLVVPSQMHYSCALCERAYESESQARRHAKRFGSQHAIVQCNQCPRKFHNLDLFNVHYAYIHQPEGIANCVTCSVEFKNKGDFITHLGNSPEAHPLSLSLGFKTFIQDACGTVACSICQKRMWNYPMNIANHTKMHKSFLCPVCQQMFPYKYALLIHLQAHTNSRNMNLVSELSQRELEQSELAELVDKLHNIVAEVESSEFVESHEKFRCPLCEGEVWRQRKNIHKHLDLHARKVLHGIREGRYFCPDCGEDIAVTEQSISDHMALHGHVAVQFVCIFCSHTFASFDEFKDHELKKHWLNAYFQKSMCDVCGKELVSRYELKKHVKLHEEKQGLFSCLRCRQTFRFEVCVS